MLFLLIQVQTKYIKKTFKNVNFILRKYIRTADRQPALQMHCYIKHVWSTVHLHGRANDKMMSHEA